jgi:hypothetical protein
MNVDQIYDRLARRGLVDSYRGMCRDFLGTAENYACSLGPEGIPSARVLIFLFRRLWAERHLLFAIEVGVSILWGVSV